MANFCAKPVKGCILEIIKLDACGLPVTGANNMVRTKGWISLNLSFDVEAGVDLLQYSACGDPLVNTKGCPALKGMNGKLILAGIDPTALSILGIGSPILSTVVITDIVGTHIKEGSSANCNRFGVKVFAVNDGDCEGAALPYTAFAFSAQNPVLAGDITFAKDTLINTEIDFYVSKTNSAYVDPFTVFTPTEFPNGKGGLLSVKGVATLPTVLSNCSFLPVP